VVQTKIQAAPDVTGAPRFVGTGRTVLNNKGLPVKQYEPFFSPTWAFEDEDAVVAAGVTPILAYDPVGRNTEVTLPDGHVQRWTYTPWQVSAYDEHDTDPTSLFHDTPATTHLDAQGRVYRSTETPDGVIEHVTHLTLDVQGNVLQVTDARGNTTQVQTFDLVGRPLFTGAADEGYDGASGRGETRLLLDVAGQPLRVWRSGNLSLRTIYDRLRRPVGTYADDGTGERRLTRTVYGDALPEPPLFAKERPVQVDDPAGRVTLGYDFRGRTGSQSRQVLADIAVDPDWVADALLDPERFTVTTSYDALDRVTSEVSPDGSNTTRTYDEGGRLVIVDVAVRGAEPDTRFVNHVEYDARGQRLSITYGNGTATTYTYDPQRFWLTRLHTVRSGTPLQDLRYTPDAAGNIVEIRDDAQQTEFFANGQVTPTRTFAYDALYRLIRATGREKVDQRQTTAFYTDYAGPPGAIPDPGDPALRPYTQSYRYDPAGNIIEMKHQVGDGGAVAWRRGYAYEAGNNQLVSTSAPGDDPDDPATHTDRYPYNDRGGMTAMPHLPALVRDHQDQIRRVELDLAGNVAWYAYDAAGQRVRKRVDKGGVQEERIYVGGYEVWRKRTSSGLQEERQTLHVMDDQRRIAMVETLTVTGGTAIANPTPRQRYQLADHLGTATLEVDEVGAVISYEECHPYGTTAWWASDGSNEVSAKRYRYTGMERDEETGLAYHGARYYAALLGRWERPDPVGLKDGIDRYAYVRGNPVANTDRTGRATTADLLGTRSPLAYSEDEYTRMPALRQQLGGTAVRQHAQEVAAHPVQATSWALVEGLVGEEVSELATPVERFAHEVGTGTTGELAGPAFESARQGQVTDELKQASMREALWALAGAGMAKAAGFVGRKVGGPLLAKVDEFLDMGSLVPTDLGDLGDARVARAAAAVVRGGADDLAARVVRLQDQVPGLRRREALGMARFEVATGRDVTPAVVDRGSDFVDRMFGQVDLKGPYVTEDLRPLDMARIVRDRNGNMVPRLDEAIGAVIREANDSGSDTIAIDLLGLTEDQTDQFVQAVQAGVGNKQLVFLR
jgi:RHS repeat-associated protein